MKTCDLRNDDWCKPIIPEGETVIFDEPGRVLDRKAEGGNYNVCYRAFSFRVTRGTCGVITLRVRHGAGDESWRIQSSTVVDALRSLSSDQRFFILHAMMEAHHESSKNAANKTACEYRRAFADGRLRKRKMRGQDCVKVWIERDTIAA